jgi:hypothetical protein
MKNGKIEETFSNIKMAKKHLRSCSTLRIIEEVQINTTIRYCCTPVKITVIKGTRDTQCVKRSP